LPDVGNDKRDAVNDGILPQAILAGAMQCTFEDVTFLLADNLGDAEGKIASAAGPADRADRLQPFEMALSHWP
jgi:hypothetical protein